jgi:hypothetical protein
MSATGFHQPDGTLHRPLPTGALPATLESSPALELQRAVMRGDREEVLKLLAEGAGVDPFEAKDTLSGKPVSCKGAMVCALMKSDADIVDGLTPHAGFDTHLLHFLGAAVVGGNPEQIRFLLDHPAMDKWRPGKMERIDVDSEKTRAWEYALRMGIIHHGDEAGTLVSEKAFDLLWGFLGQHDAHDLIQVVRIPLGSSRPEPTAAPTLLPHVFSRLWTDFPSPNIWFALLARGEFDVCRKWLPVLESCILHALHWPGIQPERVPLHGIPALVASFSRHPKEEGVAGGGGRVTGCSHIRRHGPSSFLQDLAKK